MTTRNERTIKFLNLTQPTMIKDLLEYSKIYFPNASRDLENEASSGRMMLEQATVIGDILAFYLEDRFKNSNFKTANDIKSLVNKAESFGYKFKGPIPAAGDTNFYLQVPATSSGGNYIPDMRYAINFKNVQNQSGNGIIFETTEDVNFTIVNISSSLESIVSKRNSSGVPTHFVLKTQAQVIAAKTVTETFAIGAFSEFKEIQLANKNVVEIVSVKDSSGEFWYEVDYLLQDTIFEGVKNTNQTEASDVPYVMKIKSVPRRFVKKNDPTTGKTTLVFGTGRAEDVGTSVVPNPSLVAIDLKGKLTFAAPFVDPQDLVQSRTLGLSPYNTTLTIQARVGGGLITNTAEKSLTDIVGKTSEYNASGLDSNSLNETLGSFSTRNLEPIQGGKDAETVDELKQYAPANFATQGRLNTKEDYIVRVLTMPAIFGNIFRSYAINNFDKQGGVSIFIIAKNNLGQCVVASNSLKQNVKTYLSAFTRMNQGIDIIDGRIINIGVEYSIVVQPGLNKNEVKLNTLSKIKDFFKIDNWQLNQPIFIDELRCLIKDVDGVLSISTLNIISKSNVINGNAYSQTTYDIKGNTRKNIIFGVSDGIFEVKFPNIDIKCSSE